MLKTFLTSLAAFLVLAALAGGIVLRAKSTVVPVTQKHYQTCLDSAEKQHTPLIDCPKVETLWDRGFDDPVAYYTLWLALFTVALAIVAVVQSFLIGRQIALARDEFVSSHRPKLRMRLLRMDEPEGGKPFKMQFTLASIGDTKATIVGVDVTIDIHSVIKIYNSMGEHIGFDTLHWSTKFPTGSVIAAGDSATLKGESVETFNIAWLSRQQAKKDFPVGRVRVIGTITYSDDRKINRCTAYYRMCSESIDRFDFMDFTKAKKRDYEYED
jgi:hypothetical protein